MKGVYWLSDSEFPASSIDSSLYTHIFYAFADLNPSTNQVTIPSWNFNAFSTFTQTVRRRNPDAKTLLSIGGGLADKSSFASMASQPRSRKSFIDSSIALARNNNFNGLDLDWEHPSSRTEMASFATLLAEWRAAVANESRSSRRPPLLLSAAVHRSSNFHGTPIPVQSLSSSLDWINVMSYDFYGPGPDWSANEAWPPAALHGQGQQVNADAGIQEWIQSGMPANKIAIGLPFFGWAWKLVNPNRNAFPAPANGSGDGSPYIDNNGYIFYKNIKKFIEDNGANAVYNDEVVSNYAYSGTTWIGYDDPRSIRRKVSYARNMGLFGYFAWEITGDDHHFTLSRTASNTWGR